MWPIGYLQGLCQFSQVADAILCAERSLEACSSKAFVVKTARLPGYDPASFYQRSQPGGARHYDFDTRAATLAKSLRPMDLGIRADLETIPPSSALRKEAAILPTSAKRNAYIIDAAAQALTKARIAHNDAEIFAKVAEANCHHMTERPHRSRPRVFWSASFTKTSAWHSC
jgi:hypothetical protein